VLNPLHSTPVSKMTDTSFQTALEYYYSQQMTRQSARLSGTGMGSAVDYPKATFAKTNYQAATGGEKSANNAFLASLICDNPFGMTAVLDADGACSAAAMLDAGIPADTVIAVNNDGRVVNNMYHALRHEYGEKADNTLFYEGDFFRALLNCDAPFALIYADFCWSCPKEGTSRYNEYIGTFCDLATTGRFLDGTYIAFTHSMAPRVEWRGNFVVDFDEILNTLLGIFHILEIPIEVVEHKSYFNTENGGRTEMAFTVLQICAQAVEVVAAAEVTQTAEWSH
jgi:hypothetical protein